ncbi:MAG: phosphate signaling complex protein PhoU [Lachnospiraceae bacterium]
MRNRFDKQLEQLNNELIKMGSLIEQAIQAAVNALVKKDVEAANAAIRFDQEVDRQEREIEALCMKLLLQQQPVAKDLRLISAALKMITDMERIGDQAADISEITIMLAKEPYVKELTLIPQMAIETILMVTHSIEAFVQKDLTLAQSVIDHDDVVDNLFNQIKHTLIELIQTDVSCGEQATDLLMVAKYFERIGDHATNIAEWVIYSITGQHESVDGKNI